MEAVWIALIAAVVAITGTASTVIMMMMKSSSDHQQRLEDAETKRRERAEDHAREDAKEVRTLADLAIIKKQSDGVLEKVTAMAKSEGRVEGGAAATKVAENTAATLALGQQQGRDAERESVSTKVKQDDEKPMPVVDKITNETGERAAAALESMAKIAGEAKKK